MVVSCVVVVVSRSVVCDSLQLQWAIACQVPLSMGFPRQEYWSGLPLPSPRDLPDPRIKLESPALQADSLPSESPGKLAIRNETIKSSWVGPCSLP